MTTVVPTRRLLLIPEVADRLRVSVRTVRPLIETGELPPSAWARSGTRFGWPNESWKRGSRKAA
jgi:hypothetical protein